MMKIDKQERGNKKTGGTYQYTVQFGPGIFIDMVWRWVGDVLRTTKNEGGMVTKKGRDFWFTGGGVTGTAPTEEEAIWQASEYIQAAGRVEDED